MSKNKQPSVAATNSGQKQSNVEKGFKPKVHNNLVKEYFRKDEIFADFISGASGGRIKVTPDMLSPSDTTLVKSDLSIRNGVRTIITKEMFRDISKKIYKEYNDKDEAHRGIIELRDVLYLNSKSAESNGAVFTPPYTIESLAVGDVEAKVKAEAGATLTVKKP